MKDCSCYALLLYILIYWRITMNMMSVCFCSICIARQSVSPHVIDIYYIHHIIHFETLMQQSSIHAWYFGWPGWWWWWWWVAERDVCMCVCVFAVCANRIQYRKDRVHSLSNPLTAHTHSTKFLECNEWRCGVTVFTSSILLPIATRNLSRKPSSLISATNPNKKKIC